MKFEIKVIGNINAEVKNVSGVDYIRPLFAIKDGETVTMTIPEAKAKLGDWENDSFKERKRKEQKGLTNFKLNVTYTEAPKEQAKDSMGRFISVKDVEVPFADLEEEYQAPEEPEKEEEPEVEEEVYEEVKVYCKALTTKGKPCKRLASKGSDTCEFHTL